MSRVQRSSQMVPRPTATQHSSLLIQKIRAAAADPCGEEEGDCNVGGGGGGVGPIARRGREGRISPLHHKKSRNLMSNFAQHRVRTHSPSPTPSPILSKVKNQSLFKLRLRSLSRERARRRGEEICFGTNFVLPAPPPLRQYPVGTDGEGERTPSLRSLLAPPCHYDPSSSA